MKIYLTTEELDELCMHIRDRIITDYSHFTTHIQLMYRYGLRVSEVMQTDGFSFDAGSNLVVKLPKQNYIRIIQPDDFTLNLDIYNFQLINSLPSYNITALQRAIKRCSIYRRLYVGNKGINTHLFRHNFAKKQFRLLQSDEAVQAVMAEKSLQSAQRYITSKIYYYG